MTAPLVLRVQNRAFLLPLRPLIYAAFADVPSVPPGQALDGISRIIDAPWCGFFLGLENWEPKGFVLALLPQNPLAPFPEVGRFYNGGSPALREALINAVLGYVRGAGYNRLRTINDTGRSNEAFARRFKTGGPVHPAGTVLEFDLEKSKPWAV